MHDSIQPFCFDDQCKIVFQDSVNCDVPAAFEWCRVPSMLGSEGQYAKTTARTRPLMSEC